MNDDFAYSSPVSYVMRIKQRYEDERVQDRAAFRELFAHIPALRSEEV